MKSEQVLEVYDQEYADSYDERFVHAPHARTAFEREVSKVRSFLEKESFWLDVACGTGKLLSQFPEVDRAGLDLSPSMLGRARQLNPDVSFHQGDFRTPIPDWENRYSLVTCMWYAYGLVETISDIEQLVSNLARWTAPAGTCFMPVWDPQALSRKIRIPYLLPERFYGGNVQIAGVVWTWNEVSGKQHEYMIAPHLDHMIAMFEAHFDEVSIVSYPLARGWRAPKRKAIKAEGKRF